MAENDYLVWKWMIPAGGGTMVTPKGAYLRLRGDVRRDIEEKVMALYAHLPYEEVTARLICDTLGINLTTLYRWFDTKNDFYLYLMGKASAKAAVPADTVWDMDDYLSCVVGKEKQLTEDERLFALSWIHAPRDVMARLIFDVYDPDDELVRNNLTRMQQEGKVRADVDIALTAFIYNTIGYNIQQYIDIHGIDSPEEAIRIKHYIYYKLLRNGIKGHSDEE